MSEHQKYRITERLDAGGMAEVYRGVSESLKGFKKNVAIKRILPHLVKNQKFVKMFLDEARLSLHLNHANIVTIIDIGQTPGDGVNPGAYFIVMEWVDGPNLKAIVEFLRRQGKRLRLPQAVYLMMEVCKGLAYAHDLVHPETGEPLHIVHRDISPPNILLSKMGEVKLVDFGLAKASSQVVQTDPGVVKGKFSYLSPEAARGEEVDRRADIFAVGVMLYELLTGKRLFYGETDYQTVEQVRQARVPSIVAQNPEVDAELEGIIRRALSRDVNQRHQSAGELQDALAQYLFSKGTKVTSRDIAQLVRDCLKEKEKSQPQQPQQPKSLIDALIQEEILKFTSLDPGAAHSPTGQDSVSSEMDGARPLDGDSFEDPRTWMDDEATIAEDGVPAGMLPELAAMARRGASSPAFTPTPAPLPAPPVQRPEPKADSSAIKPLEQILETVGEPSSPNVGRSSPASVTRPMAAAPPPRRSRAGFWVFLALVLLISGGAVLLLVNYRHLLQR